MCAFGVELTLPVHRRARQDPYAGGTTGRRAAGLPPGDPWGVPRPDPIGGIRVGKGLIMDLDSSLHSLIMLARYTGYRRLIPGPKWYDLRCTMKK